MWAWFIKWLGGLGAHATLYFVLLVSAFIVALDPDVWRSGKAVQIVFGGLLTGFVVGVAIAESGFPLIAAYIGGVLFVFIGPAGLYALRNTPLSRLADGADWFAKLFGRGQDKP